MFDFFKDMFHELGGVDTKATKMLRDEKREQEKLSRFLFTKGMKAFIYVVGASYLLFASAMVAASMGIVDNSFYLIKYAVLIMIDIAICMCLLTGTRKGEIAAIVGGLLFVMLMFATVLMA